MPFGSVWCYSIQLKWAPYWMELGKIIRWRNDRVRGGGGWATLHASATQETLDPRSFLFLLMTFMTTIAFHFLLLFVCLYVCIPKYKIVISLLV